jgi:hypothetical protein
LKGKLGESQVMFRNSFGTAQAEKDSQNLFAAKEAVREKFKPLNDT